MTTSASDLSHRILLRLRGFGFRKPVVNTWGRIAAHHARSVAAMRRVAWPPQLISLESNLTNLHIASLVETDLACFHSEAQP